MEQNRALGRWWLVVVGVAVSAAFAAALWGAWLTAEALADGRPVATGARFLGAIGAGWYCVLIARFGHLQFVKVTGPPGR